MKKLIFAAAIAALIFTGQVRAQDMPLSRGFRSNLVAGHEVTSEERLNLSPDTGGIVVQLSNQGTTLAIRGGGLVNWNCGSGMTCTFSGTTFTMTASGSGSGTVSSGTTGYISQYTGSTTVGNSSPILDNGITTANTLTYAGSGGITASGGPITSGNPTGGVGSSVFLVQEGTVPSGLSTSGQDDCYADSTQHGLLCNFNAGTTLPLVQGPASSTSGDLADFNVTNGGRLADSGVVAANVITDASNLGAAGILYQTGNKTAAASTNGTLTSAGAAVFAASVATGTPPAVTCGTGGCFSATEGTIATGLSTADTFSPDSTHHCWDNNANNVDLGCTPGVTAAGLTSTAIVTAGASSFNLQTPSATSTLSSGGNMSLAGTMAATGTYEAAATNTALTVQAGVDAATQASTAALTVRGEDVTGGSTASLTGGALTIRGGNNASTGNTSIGGAVTLNGGDATGGTGTSDAGGAVTLRGGNYTNTAASGSGGSMTVQAGSITGAATNLQAADTIIASGVGTGNAIASHTKIQSPTYSQTSGTTAQTLVTTYTTVKKAGSTSSGTPTNMVSFAATGVPSAGGMIIVHVYTTQAAPHTCSDTGIWEFSVANEGPTTNINRVDATVTTICDTGTMTMTAALSAANPAVFSVTPTWTTIVPTAVWIEITIINPSDVDVTLISD